MHHLVVNGLTCEYLQALLQQAATNGRSQCSRRFKQLQLQQQQLIRQVQCCHLRQVGPMWQLKLQAS
jgi:hypothetical protein